MELVPIITTLLTYGVIILTLLIVFSYTLSKRRNGSKLKLQTIESEESTRRIFQQKMNDAQVRILADKEEIKKGNIQYLRKASLEPLKEESNRFTKLDSLPTKDKSRYEVLNNNNKVDYPNIYSISGNF